MRRAATDGRLVADSSASAIVIAASPRLAPAKRNGSRSHRGDLWFTQGSVLNAVGVSVISSARVRPARFVVLSPSPT
jgi:hypothetical protein